MIDLGDIYPAALNVFDSNGLPINPLTVVLTINLPDGTAVTPVVPNPPATTGQLQYQYLTTLAGRHTVRWVTTVPNTAYTDVFDVAELTPPSILSLASAKRALQMSPTYTDDDDELREKLAAITAGVQNYKHETIVFTTVVEKHNYATAWMGGSGGLGGNGRGRLKLWQYPPVQLLSLVSQDGSFTWDVANFDLDTTTGLVSLLQGPPVRGRFIVTYTAGYTIIPYNYVEATKTLLQHIWESRRGPGGVGGVAGPEELADFRHYTALPRKVTEMLGPPRPVVA